MKILAAAGATGPTLQDLLPWSATPSKRCLILTCLGQRHPQRQQELHAAAAELNFSTRFPHRQLATVLGQKT
jgi:hypothetical protein